MNVFSKWDKHSLVVIINDFKSIWGKLLIPFLSRLFTWKIGVQFCLKWNKSQKQKISRKKPHTILFFRLQHEVLKFNDVCVSWSLQKTNLKMNILSLENRSFENVSFCQRKLFTGYCGDVFGSKPGHVRFQDFGADKFTWTEKKSIYLR